MFITPSDTGPRYRVSPDDGAAEVLTTDECDSFAALVWEVVGLCEATDYHGLVAKAVEKCVVVRGAAWLTASQAAGFAADLVAAGVVAEKYEEPKKSHFGRTNKRRACA